MTDTDNSAAPVQHPPAKRLSLKRRLLVLFISTSLSIGLAECAIRFALPGFPGFKRPQIQHRPSDATGFEMVPNQTGYTLAEEAQIDSNGLRVNKSSTQPRDSDIQIICLGDSFTFGFGVPDESTYPAQLEGNLYKRNRDRKYHVMNAGVQGYATYHELARLEELLKKFKPQLVTLAIYFNDVTTRPEGKLRDPYQIEFDAAAKPVARTMKAVNELLKKSALCCTAMGIIRSGASRDKTREMIERTSADVNSSAWKDVTRELRRFTNLSQKHGFSALVIVIPPKSELSDSDEKTRYRENLAQICAHLELTVLDVTPALMQAKEAGRTILLPWDNHFSAEGNRVVADEISALVTRQLEAQNGRKHP